MQCEEFTVQELEYIKREFELSDEEMAQFIKALS